MAGIRRGYTVTYRKTKEVDEFVEGNEKRISIFDPQQTEISVEGLEYNCRYSFKIRVFNTRFFGDDSEAVFGGNDKFQGRRLISPSNLQFHLVFKISCYSFRIG